jgi:hypothetical protein
VEEVSGGVKAKVVEDEAAEEAGGVLRAAVGVGKFIHPFISVIVCY